MAIYIGATAALNGPQITETNMADAIKDMSFEDALRELEGIVAKLERGEAPLEESISCLLYTSPSPRDKRQSRMPSSA